MPFSHLSVSERDRVRDDAVRLRDLLRGVHSAGKMLAGMAIALLAWGATQIYTDLKTPPTPAAVADTP